MLSCASQNSHCATFGNVFPYPEKLAPFKSDRYTEQALSSPGLYFVPMLVSLAFIFTVTSTDPTAFVSIV